MFAWFCFANTATSITNHFHLQSVSVVVSARIRTNVTCVLLACDKLTRFKKVQSLLSYVRVVYPNYFCDSKLYTFQNFKLYYHCVVCCSPSLGGGAGGGGGGGGGPAGAGGRAGGARAGGY